MKLRSLLLLSFVFAICAVFEVNAQAKKKVIFEKFTSASCGNCPTGIGEIERLLDVYGDDCIIWVSHHAGWLWDPMLFDEINTIASDFASGAPTGMIDRTNNLGSNWLASSPSTWEDQVVDALALPAKVGLSFSGNYNAVTRTIDFSVTSRFESSVTPGDIRLNVMIIEDKVNEGTSNYNQANYFNNSPGHPFQGAGNPIVGYEHRNVTRAVLDAAWGTDNVIPDNPSLNTNYSSNYTYTLPENFDESQVSIVAFVSYYDADADNREIINGDIIHINDLVSTSTNQVSFIETAEINPNPAFGSTTIIINANTPKAVNIQLMNVQGQAVRSWRTNLLNGENNFPVDLNGLASGTYLLIVEDGAERLTRKLVVR